MFRSVIVSAAAVFMTISASAEERVEVEITVDRAAIQTEEGARELLREIEREALRVCRPHGVRGIDAIDRARDCVAEIVERAVERIGDPIIARLYRNEVRLQLASN